MLLSEVISHNNKYYYKKDGYYYYETKRRVMNKEDYNKLDLKYNDKNIDEYFISLLFEDYEISNLYSNQGRIAGNITIIKSNVKISLSSELPGAQ